jgi:hypothetical protein
MNTEPEAQAVVEVSSGVYGRARFQSYPDTVMKRHSTNTDRSEKCGDGPPIRLRVKSSAGSGNLCRRKIGNIRGRATDENVGHDHVNDRLGGLFFQGVKGPLLYPLH